MFDVDGTPVSHKNLICQCITFSEKNPQKYMEIDISQRMQRKNYFRKIIL